MAFAGPQSKGGRRIANVVAYPENLLSEDQGREALPFFGGTPQTQTPVETAESTTRGQFPPNGPPCRVEQHGAAFGLAGVAMPVGDWGLGLVDIRPDGTGMARGKVDRG